MRLINWLRGIKQGRKNRGDRRERSRRGGEVLRTRRARLPRLESLEERSMLYGGNGLEFNISHTATVPQQAKDAFQIAANYWSTLLVDDILLNVTVDFSPNAAGIGQTLRVNTIKTYGEIRDALIAQQQSPSDATAVAHLPSGDSVALYTTNFHTGVPMFDDNGTDNNSAFSVTRPNAKALGLRAANDPGIDGTIRFRSGLAFDYDQSNGISAGQYDFVGVAMHEIGHLLGFISGADVVDFKSKPNGAGYSSIADQDNQIVAYPFDLFRHSAASVAAGADLDLRADLAAKYFSLDGGATQLATFSTGRYNGNGFENQHWQHNLGIGVMSPSVATGEYNDVTWRDVQALDVIGWDVAMDYGDAPVLIGTPGDDLVTVAYFAASVSVTRATNGGAAVLLGTYPLGTSIVVDGLEGNDQLSLVLTPQLLGDLTTADLLVLKNYLVAPAGQTLQLVVPGFGSLGTLNFESAKLGIYDDSRVTDVTTCMPGINSETQIQIGGDGSDDQLVGTNLVDLIFGQGGNDLLYALDGADCLFGGAGNDTIYGGNANDRLAGGSGDDSLVGGANDDQLDGGSGADSVAGGAGNDSIMVRTDEALHDVIDGGDNSDTIVNDLAEPVVIGDFNAATSKVEFWLGNNQPILGTDAANVMTFMISSTLSMTLTAVPYIDGRGGNDAITGTMGNDVLRGGDGDDRLYGMSGGDVLYGDAGNDVLGGGDGNDYLLGGDGADTMATGAGRDIVTFSGDLGSLDIITDFASSLDLINLKPYGINYAMLSFDLISQPGSTIITLPGGKKIRLLNWSAVVPPSQMVF